MVKPGEQRYKRNGSRFMGKGERNVFVDDSGRAHFHCPCDARMCSITPEHNFTFDGANIMSAEGSVLAREWVTERHGKCHFKITDGIPTMCGDSTCPGAD